MKIACEIIQDLIPLYADNSLSIVSRNAVEEHLKECPACREYLQQAQAACRDLDRGRTKEDFIAEALTLKKAKQKIRRKKIITIALSAAAAILAVLLAGYGFISSSKGSFLPITDTEEITVSYDAEGNLVADIEGTVVMRTRIKTLDLDDNGRRVRCLIFGSETTKWEELQAGENEFSRVALAFADKGAAEVDRVYYLSPDIGEEDEQFGALSGALTANDLRDAKLIYETPESLNWFLQEGEDPAGE